MAIKRKVKKTDYRKILKFVILPLTITICGAIIFKFIIEPTFSRLYKLPQLKKESFQKISKHLNDKDLRVRNASIIALGNIGNVESVSTLLRTLREQSSLATENLQYLKKNSKELGKRDIIKTINDISVFFKRKKFKKFEEEDTKVFVCQNLIRILRNFKFLINVDNLTEKEKNHIDNLKIDKKLDILINQLEGIVTESSKYQKESFMYRILDLSNLLDQLQNTVAGLKKSETPKLINSISELKQETEFLYKKMTDEKEIPENKTIEQYSNLIELLGYIDNNHSQKALLEAAKNKNVPISIRVKAIEGIGLIGDDLNAFETLIELVESEDVRLKIAAIISLGKILVEDKTKRANWVEYWN